MKDKEFFLKMLSTMFWSYDSEPSVEVIWIANEMLDWLELELNIQLNVRFTEDSQKQFNYDNVIKTINNI